MSHIMLDIETLGRAPGFIVLSIGAVAFDLSGKTFGEFYVNIARTSSVDAGLKVDPETSRWWQEQPEAARAALQIDVQPLGKSLDAFRMWFAKQGGVQVWGQGASFDPPILEGAFKAAGVPVPWKFWNVRDTRTVYDLFDFDTRTVAMGGVKHNALDDARHQVKLVAAALRKGRMPTAPATAPARDDKHFDDALANDDIGSIFG